MKQIFIFIILIITINLLCDNEIPCVNDYSFSYQEKFETDQDVFFWMKHNYDYDITDDSSDIKTPAKTYGSRKGSCADWDILSLQFLHDLGYQASYVIIKRPGRRGGHAVIRHENKIIEAFGDEVIYDYEIVEEFEYCEAIGMAVND